MNVKQTNQYTLIEQSLSNSNLVMGTLIEHSVLI